MNTTTPRPVRQPVLVLSRPDQHLEVFAEPFVPFFLIPRFKQWKTTYLPPSNWPTGWR